METEKELGKVHEKDSDDGYSEKKIAKNVDKNSKTQNSAQGGNIFASQKTNKTVFQAQKSEEK